MLKASRDQAELPHKSEEGRLRHGNKDPVFPPSEFQGGGSVPPGVGRLDSRSCERKNGSDGTNPPLLTMVSMSQCQNRTVPMRFQWSHHVFPSLQHRNKINRAGELIVTSEESRYQMRNLAICLEKIRTMVTEAIEKPKVVSKETTQKLIERYLH